MSQITKAEFWKDTGFMDGAVEVPSTSDTLPTPDAVYEEGIKTSTGDFFSNFTIPEVFADYLSMSYVRVTYTYNNHSDEMVLYGWVDDVALRSDTENNPSVSISWHIDYWRTYLANARFGYGMVLNRPRSIIDPLQACSYRWREAGTPIPVKYSGIAQDCYWMIVNYADEKITRDSQGNITSDTVVQHQLVCPVVTTIEQAVYFKLGLESTTVYTAPTLKDFITGSYDEKLDIAPSAISSAYISPIPPFEVMGGTGTPVDPYYMLSDSGTTETERTGVGVGEDAGYVIGYNGYRTESDGVVLKMAKSDGTQSEHQTGTDVWNDCIFNYLASSDYRGSKEVTISVAGNFRFWSNYLVLTADEFFRGMLGAGSAGELGNGTVVSLVNAQAWNGYVKADPDKPHKEGSTWIQGYQPVVFSPDGATYTELKYENGAWNHAYVAVPTDGINDVRWTVRIPTQYTKYDFDVLSKQSGTAIYGMMYSKNQNMNEFSVTLSEEIQTSDTREWMFTDMDGSPLGVLPWGWKIRNLAMRVVASFTSAYIQVRADGTNSHAEGLSWTVPLPSIDISSNSWSEYVASGSRDADIANRRIANEQALTSGVVSSLTGGIDSAIMGALTNTTTKTDEKHTYSYGRESATEEIKGINTTHGIGGWKSGAIGMGTGVAGASINYKLTEMYNGQLQKVEDLLQAKQIDSIIMAGSGWDWLYHGRPLAFVPMTPDQYSRDRFDDDIRLNGITCSEPMDECQSLVDSGGPLRISELVVTGDIPVQARGYFRGRFSNGVRIKTINTVTPTEE